MRSVFPVVGPAPLGAIVLLCVSKCLLASPCVSKRLLLASLYVCLLASLSVCRLLATIKQRLAHSPEPDPATALAAATEDLSGFLGEGYQPGGQQLALFTELEAELKGIHELAHQLFPDQAMGEWRSWDKFAWLIAVMCTNAVGVATSSLEAYQAALQDASAKKDARSAAHKVSNLPKPSSLYLSAVWSKLREGAQTVAVLALAVLALDSFARWLLLSCTRCSCPVLAVLALHWLFLHRTGCSCCS